MDKNLPIAWYLKINESNIGIINKWRMNFYNRGPIALPSIYEGIQPFGYNYIKDDGWGLKNPNVYSNSHRLEISFTDFLNNVFNDIKLPDDDLNYLIKFLRDSNIE